MEKIDCLGWVAGMAIQTFGVRLGLRVNTPGALGVVASYLPPGCQPVASPVVDHLSSIIMGGASFRRGVRRYHVLYSDWFRAVRTLEQEDLLHRLARILDFQVALHAPHRIFVHAGVVGWQGRALLIPGRSFSGKTTLVKALVEAGATYYSDEFAVLDFDGSVHAYPRPLNIRQADHGPGTPTPVETIGGEVGHFALKVGWVLETSYESGRTWRPQRLSPVQTALCLLGNTVIARLRPERVFPVLRKVGLESCGLGGERGEAEEMTDQLLAKLAE